MKTVLILGHYGVVNWGDEAILMGLLAQLQEKKMKNITPLFGENISPIVVSKNPEWTTKEYGVHSVSPPPFGIRSFFKKTKKSFFGVLKKSDAVIIGGGGLFQPYPWQAFWIWGYYLFLSLIFQKPVYILGNSFEAPSKKTVISFFLRALFSKVQHFTVRENASLEVLKNFWNIDETKISVFPDFAYSIRIPSSLSHVPQKKIGCMMREGDLNTNLEKIIIEGLKKHFPDYSLQNIVMQSTQAQDEQFGVRNSLPIFSPKHFSELIEEIQGCAFIVSSRLHGNILAEVVHKPFIAIAPRAKIKNLFGENAITPEELDEKNWEKKMRSVL